jgi:hypothetical protein
MMTVPVLEDIRYWIGPNTRMVNPSTFVIAENILDQIGELTSEDP